MFRRARRQAAVLSVLGVLIALVGACSDTRTSGGQIPVDPPAVLVGHLNSEGDWGLRLDTGVGKPLTLGWAEGATVYRQYAATPAQLADGDCVSVDLESAPSSSSQVELVAVQLFVLGRLAAPGAPATPPSATATTDPSATASTSSSAADTCASVLRQAVTPGRWSGALEVLPGGGLRLSRIVETGSVTGRASPTTSPSTSPTTSPTTTTAQPAGWPGGPVILRLGPQARIWLTEETMREQLAVGDCVTIAVARQFGLPAAGRITVHPAGRDVCGRVTGDSQVMVPVSHWVDTGAASSSTGPTGVGPSARPSG